MYTKHTFLGALALAAALLSTNIHAMKLDIFISENQALFSPVAGYQAQADDGHSPIQLNTGSYFSGDQLDAGLDEVDREACYPLPEPYKDHLGAINIPGDYDGCTLYTDEECEGGALKGFLAKGRYDVLGDLEGARSMQCRVAPLAKEIFFFPEKNRQGEKNIYIIPNRGSCVNLSGDEPPRSVRVGSALGLCKLWNVKNCRGEFASTATVRTVDIAERADNVQSLACGF